jgi:hypothetical protein
LHLRKSFLLVAKPKFFKGTLLFVFTRVTVSGKGASPATRTWRFRLTPFNGLVGFGWMIAWSVRVEMFLRLWK